MPNKNDLYKKQIELENELTERMNLLIEAPLGLPYYRLLCGQIIATTRELQKISHEYAKLTQTKVSCKKCGSVHEFDIPVKNYICDDCKRKTNDRF